jgi:hypothetical protein
MGSDCSNVASSSSPLPRFELQNLPSVSVLHATCTAREPQRLPALATTSLHGALSRALHDLAPELVKAPPGPNAGLGVTDRAPAPLVVAVEPTDIGGFDKPFTELSEGETIRFRLVLLGRAAAQKKFLLAAALERAVSSGLGVWPNPESRGNKKRRKRRPRLELTDFSQAKDTSTSSSESTETDTPSECRPDSRQAELGTQLTLDFFTPVRLTHQGQIASKLDGRILWAALLRRADTLARAHGSGPVEHAADDKVLPSLSDDTIPVPLDIAAQDLQVVSVTRFSSRQRKKMRWPGLVGRVGVRICPDAQVRVWPLISFCERAQIGKATSFGFGRYLVERKL